MADQPATPLPSSSSSAPEQTEHTVPYSRLQEKAREAQELRKQLDAALESKSRVVSLFQTGISDPELQDFATYRYEQIPPESRTSFQDFLKSDSIRQHSAFRSLFSAPHTPVATSTTDPVTPSTTPHPATPPASTSAHAVAIPAPPAAPPRSSADEVDMLSKHIRSNPKDEQSKQRLRQLLKG